MNADPTKQVRGSVGIPADRQGADSGNAVERAVELRGATKRYGSVVAADGVDLVINPGEFFTLLGPSGSGKTTILRMIAGLIEPTAGTIHIDGKDMTGLRAYDRPIAMVFQSLALFPHMDVFANLAFPLRMQRVGRKEIARRVAASLEIVRLPSIANRRIDELSGGQRQRVAFARALIYEPRLLLLDEPLGALDQRLREEMQIELVRLHQQLDVTIVNVTHDQREALMLSDRIAVVDAGRIEQIGAGETLYQEPHNRFVASFVGDSTLIDGILATDGSGSVLTTANGASMRIATTAVESGAASLVLRSRAVRIAATESVVAGYDNKFSGRVDLAVFDGSGYYYEIFAHDLAATIKVAVPRSERESVAIVGDEVWLGWHRDDAPVVARDNMKT